MQSKTLHVLSEFGRCPMHLTLQSPPGKYVTRRQCMSQDRILKQACIADCRLQTNCLGMPDSEQSHDFLVSTPLNTDTFARHTLTINQKCIYSSDPDRRL